VTKVISFFLAIDLEGEGKEKEEKDELQSKDGNN
jgi:hypothetical protein